MFASPVVTNTDMRVMMLLQQEQAKMQRRRAKRFHEYTDDHECKKLRLSYSNSTTTGTSTNTNTNTNNISTNVELRHNESNSEPYAEVEDYMVKGYCLDQNGTIQYDSSESMDID